jgi:excisionase family DNA binding protein
MPSPYLTISEVSAELEISKDGVYKLVKRGKLPAIRLSERGMRISRLALDAYKRRLRGEQPLLHSSLDYESAENAEQLRDEFDHQTGMTPQEWDRRWRANEIEDSADNMQLTIRALALLLAEQAEGEHHSAFEAEAAAEY